MKCRTCAHCAIIDSLNGACHGAPPQIYFLRWIKVDGSDHIVADTSWNQLIPSYLAGAFPPVNPSNRGCRLHSFSLLTWWRWKFGKQIKIPAPVVQEKA